MKNITVILAGGSGKRMGGSLPKQFLILGEKPIIQHSIEAFENHPQTDEICIIIHADFIHEVECIVKENNFNKVKHILPGGKERSDSSLAAIHAYQEEQNINLIFHDAVRPFVSSEIISNVIRELNAGKSVAVAITTVDTIFEVDEKNKIVSVPQRSFLRRAQTPQAFPYHTIKSAYEIALKDPDFVATDDCGVVLKYLPTEAIYIVEGDESNIKITFEGDLVLGEQILQAKS
ncbi:IspD/TarI family cytidylyltransferase [Labilibaculum euxinus]|uniref:2-C-methyl-D-erythritol 4-phosphate cytidylyltransferase n=1 Tax=Labilibaculum euxinus TaxID=2686357 RepID=A0A7M4D8W3_9BACT|nr:IspD/TarI family cytidylyltransferase [Labilibaculum euxinus]MUP39092.1 NTP transferase domain-containing protein [Labilibaculum euxinus]MVB08297.1 NTP transferase domain-containing protein [Labilibaculum euxinus]